MSLAWDGRWNLRLGWLLLVAGFAVGAFLDPWSLAERDPSHVVGSPRMATRHAQAVLVGMAFLQLAVGRLLATRPFRPATRVPVGFLTGSGAAVYAAGYLLSVVFPAAAWLIVAGALLNFAGFACFAAGAACFKTLRLFLAIFCGGMLIDAVMGLFAADGGRFSPGFMGPEDGVRLRMLRLARAAVIALSLLALLYQGLAARSSSNFRVVRWGGVLLAFGALGMPLLLTAAAFTSLDLKYLLGLPAQATLFGTLVGTWLALSYARPLERWGWFLVAVSMSAGLLMGTYAFDGPFPSPEFLGAYNDYGRRLLRLGHAYCIVLGLLSIVLARRLDERAGSGWLSTLGTAVLTAGGVVLLAGITAAATSPVPPGVLSVGPALVAAGMVCCLLSSTKKAGHSPAGAETYLTGASQA